MLKCIHITSYAYKATGWTAGIRFPV